MEYNSTRGNWTAFTPYSTGFLEYLNNNPYEKQQREVEKQLCTDRKDTIHAAGMCFT